jgi:hypothetical protein
MTAGQRPLLELGWAGTALEAESGDVHVVAEFDHGVLVGVIDGLGHGYEAAVAGGGGGGGGGDGEGRGGAGVSG